ncbi:MAG: hypothetical protein EOO75_19810, partial [Myxococcales bacterium]
PALAALALGLLACCRPPAETTGPLPLYSVGTVSRLVSGRLGPAGALFVAEQDDGSRQAIAVDARGEDVWNTRPVAQVLLGPTLDAPVYTVALGDGPRQVSVLAPSTGRVERAFTVDRPRQPHERWERDGDDLLLIEAAGEKAAVTVVAIDGATGATRWTRVPGVAVPLDVGWAFHSPVIVQGDSIHLFCLPAGSPEYYPDLCRLARADGSLTATRKGPFIDMAAAARTLFVLRSDAVEALADDGAARWRRPLTPQYQGATLLARDGWLVALSSLARSNNEHQEQLLALDPADGHPLWTRDTSPGGEHYQKDIALSDERLFFVSNLDPNMRVVDRQGALVLGASWKTRLAAPTEAAGGFVEGMRGTPLFEGPF